MWKNRRTSNSRRKLCIEALEQRMLLAGGNVTAIQNGVGQVSVVGDSGDNSITIEPAAGPNGIVIMGQGGTTVNNGAAVTFTGVTRLDILFLDGMDTLFAENLLLQSPQAPVSITMGKGNDQLTFRTSTVAQLAITIGTEQPGDVGNITATVNNDVITASGMSVRLLNESGVSSKLLNGTMGVSPGSMIQCTINSNQVTGGINTRIDDGIVLNPAPSTFTPSSSLQMNGNLTTGGEVRDVLGDDFQRVQSDNNTIGGNLTELMGNGFVTLEGNGNQIQGGWNFRAGNDFANNSALMSPSITLSGNSVGIGPTGGNVQATFGSNVDATKQFLPFRFNNNHNRGDVKIIAANNGNIVIDPTDDTGRLDITMGNGGINHIESLTMLGVDSGDPYIIFHSLPGDTVNINLTDVMVTDPHGVFYMRDFGVGVDHVLLSNLTVAGPVFNIYLSGSGHNDVTAKNVTAHGGFILNAAIYTSLGGNGGYFVFGHPGPP